MTKILLCSASPRRKELLSKLVRDFEVVKSNVSEESAYQMPHLRVMDLARKKGRFVDSTGRVVIASDTLVYRGGKYYGKPQDREDARKMLSELAGVRHSVYTGVYVARDGEETLFYDKATVLFKALTPKEVDAYLDAFAPYDKAGAYGIQDGVVVKSYYGSFDTIMGLPTEKLGEILQKMGVRDVHKRNRH